MVLESWRHSSNKHGRRYHFQVSANVDAGFSVATYTGNGSTGTIGHGLSKKPEFVIIKNRGDVVGAYVGSPSFGTNNYLNLNGASGLSNYVDGAGGSFFNYGGWSDSVVNVYNSNSTGYQQQFL
jgi:hypothetical protein